MNNNLNYENKRKKHQGIIHKWLMIAKSDNSGLEKSELLTKLHTEVGRLWEIPECCIKQWCDEVELGINPAISREFYHKAEIPRNMGYVPCDECMENITKGRIIGNIKEILKRKYKHGDKS